METSFFQSHRARTAHDMPFVACSEKRSGKNNISALAFVLSAILFSVALQSCASVQGSKSDYFGYDANRSTVVPSEPDSYGYAPAMRTERVPANVPITSGLPDESIVTGAYYTNYIAPNLSAWDTRMFMGSSLGMTGGGMSMWNNSWNNTWNSPWNNAWNSPFMGAWDSWGMMGGGMMGGVGFGMGMPMGGGMFAPMGWASWNRWRWRPSWYVVSGPLWAWSPMMWSPLPMAFIGYPMGFAGGGAWWHTPIIGGSFIHETPRSLRPFSSGARGSVNQYAPTATGRMRTTTMPIGNTGTSRITGVPDITSPTGTPAYTGGARGRTSTAPVTSNGVAKPSPQFMPVPATLPKSGSGTSSGGNSSGDGNTWTPSRRQTTTRESVIPSAPRSPSFPSTSTGGGSSAPPRGGARTRGGN